MVSVCVRSSEGGVAFMLVNPNQEGMAVSSGAASFSEIGVVSVIVPVKEAWPLW